MRYFVALHWGHSLRQERLPLRGGDALNHNVPFDDDKLAARRPSAIQETRMRVAKTPVSAIERTGVSLNIPWQLQLPSGRGLTALA